MSESKVIKGQNFTWQGVERKEYKSDRKSYRGVHRYTLLEGREKEPELNFETRYFEVQPGGFTSLEYHRHPHSVMIIRGAGSVIMDDEIHDISLHDVVFIAPQTIHQFQADKGEALGFICVVDRYRDRPTLPDREKLNEVMGHGKARNSIKKG